MRGADHSTLALNKSVDVHTLDDHPGGWHTNRAGRRAYFGKSPRNLMLKSETVWASDSDSMRGADHNQNPVRGARQGHRQFFERTSTLHWVEYNRVTSL